MNIMIDIETLGMTPRAPIVAIGACAFDMNAIRRKFYRAINIDLERFDADASTLRWWLAQGPAARGVFSDPERIDVAQALEDMHEWAFDAVAGRPFKVWAKPPRFDIAIVENAMQVCGIRPLWGHRDVLDMRTAIHLLDPSGEHAVPFTGTVHNALHDAVWQAEYLQAVLCAKRAEASHG